VTEPSLVPLNRPADRNPERSTAREQLAVALERMAARVRADDGPMRFYGWSYASDRLTVNEVGEAPKPGPNAELTTFRITWRKP
jgi:hypothetical protein